MHRLLALAVVASLVLAGSVWAQGSGSIDFQGPLALPSGGPLSAGDIAVPTPPAPGPGPLPPPTPIITPGMLGVVGSPALPYVLPDGTQGFDAEVDALSYGRDWPWGPGVIFSVDEFAIGIPGPMPPDVFTEGIAGSMEASADTFVTTPAPWLVPPGFFGFNIAATDGDGFAPSGAPGIGLIEPNPPTPGMLPDHGDNLDALDVDMPGPWMGPDEPPPPIFPVFYSLDSAFPDPLEVPPANSGTAMANGFVGGDVLVTMAPGGPPAVYAPAAALGLDFGGMEPDLDDLDALALWDDGMVIDDPAGGEPVFFYHPDNDWLVYSVRRGSAVIGMPDLLSGAPIEEGDLLMSPLAFGAPIGAPPAIVLPAEAMGLATVRSGTAIEFNHGDDLDALDVVPEPGTLALLAFGALFGAAWALRRRVA